MHDLVALLAIYGPATSEELQAMHGQDREVITRTLRRWVNQGAYGAYVAGSARGAHGQTCCVWHIDAGRMDEYLAWLAAHRIQSGIQTQLLLRRKPVQWDGPILTRWLPMSPYYQLATGVMR